VTIILTTHYIEEAEEMADRIGVIRKGELILVEDKHTLMRKLGTRQLTLHLLEPMTEVPATLRGWSLSLAAGGMELQYHFNNSSGQPVGIPALLRRMSELGIGFKDLDTSQSSLEEIFVGLVNARPDAAS
jgi:ABC-2 type transport system ATP-binding protein